jgi:hypothetical protein
VVCVCMDGRPNCVGKSTMCTCVAWVLLYCQQPGVLRRDMLFNLLCPVSFCCLQTVSRTCGGS